ncbi:MAG TPA: choice-of-anchor tandem repeat GloVer-containing protein [Terriglobales bacterium]|jgi:hypothetical protein|nr:choice-of-anchor tandem repeat GloVer-containing protein [Terriglobales bacterium]
MINIGTTARNLTIAVATVLALAVSALALDSEKTVFTFGGGKSGAVVGTNLVADSDGNVYGTTISGGNNSSACEIETGVPGCGVVFKLTPRAHGTWEETVLYAFTGGKDGAGPIGGVVLDSAGNLYGTTNYGGRTTAPACQISGYVPGCGVVFMLTPTANGPWTETLLHSFTGGSDGAKPFSGVILDASGNVYGAADYGGDTGGCDAPHGCGVVFGLKHGTWEEKVLHSFTGGSDGFNPLSGVTLDSQGNLYGVTYQGGDTSASCFGVANGGCGVVYELTPTRHGPWTETVLYAFTGGADGAMPLLGVTLDSHGNVYGTTLYGGDTTASNCLGGYGFDVPPGCGLVFGLRHGTWEETVLYSFTGGNDGAFSGNPVVFDSAGNLYGSTENGGDLSAPCSLGTDTNPGCGVVFKLRPAANGPWDETVLYAFTGGADGSEPESNLLLGPDGSIFGITEAGGNTSECTGNFSGAGCGVVFGIK